MSNVSKPIFIQGSTLPVTVTGGNAPAGTAMTPLGAPASSWQTFAGILLYDTNAGENGELAGPGSRVYARVNSSGALSAGTALKVGATAGTLDAVASGTDPVNAILLEPHTGGGVKLVKVLVK